METPEIAGTSTPFRSAPLGTAAHRTATAKQEASASVGDNPLSTVLLDRVGQVAARLAAETWGGRWIAGKTEISEAC